MDISCLTGLGPVLDPIICRRSSLFGHVARLPEDIPAHQALQCHTDLSLGPVVLLCLWHDVTTALLLDN